MELDLGAAPKFRRYKGRVLAVELIERHVTNKFKSIFTPRNLALRHLEQL